MSTQTEPVRQQAADAAGAAKQAAQEQVGQVADAGRGAVRRQIDQRSTQAGTHARGVADTLRQTASQLRSDGDPQKTRYADVADQAADRLERTGRYLTDADSDELLGRVEGTARQQPWLVAAAGLLVGAAAARFVKASSRERYHRHTGTVYEAQMYRQARPLPPAEPVSGGYPAAATTIEGRDAWHR